MLKTTTPAAGVEQLSPSFIDSVKNAADIEQVVGQYVALKKSGNNLFGLCPFHGEKSPSFSVSPAKQMYHCFGCGSNGDCIKFLMEYAALSFREAVTELAQRSGIPIPSATGAPAAAVDLGGMVKVNELSAAFFRHCLRHTDKAKEYVSHRRITPQAAKRFVIGYAPEGWQSLKEAFGDYGTSSLLVELGLVIAKEDAGGRRYDRFRNRLMFGIRDARGRLVGWGGRSIDASEPKYLNSPQSSLFDKGSQLFGVFEARESIRRAKQIIVTEGYIDTVANAMAGLEQTVATMGTACTHAHLDRLVTLAPEVVFCFDGDKAGMAAAWKSMKSCLAFASDERSFKFLILPDGMDPDEAINKLGTQTYCKLVEDALPLSSFMLTQLSQNHGGLKTLEEKAQYMREGTDLIQSMPPSNLKRILREALASSAGLQPSLPVPAGPLPRLHRPRAESNAWTALAKAAAMQPRTAALHAERIIEQLDQVLQDAFFASNFDAFPLQQQTFWRAIDAAVLDEALADQDSGISAAQRDLLGAAAEAIAKQRDKDARAASRGSFRSGETSEDDYLSSLSFGQEKRDHEGPSCS